jgi:ketosteroid isomerase-like protein
VKNDDTAISRTISRRSALAGAAAGGAALAGAWALPSSPAEAASGTSATAPGGIQRLFASFLAAKSAADVDGTMAFFDRSVTYWDATAGFDFPDWAALKAVFAQYMPTWGPAAHSYETNLLGDDTGAALFFTNTPEEFGHEIRGISVVDIRDGRFIRWIDYWDGRHFGIAALEGFRSPPSTFPSDFGWSLPGENASSKLKRTVSELALSLGRGNYQDAARLFDENGVLEDLTLHTAVAGPQSIAGYLQRAVSTLPNGLGASVRHVVGGDTGGAYEWTNSGGPVPRGVSALQLNATGQIVRLSTIWDGSTVDASWLTQRMAETIES